MEMIIVIAVATSVIVSMQIWVLVYMHMSRVRMDGIMDHDREYYYKCWHWIEKKV